jgi:tetratricopeptide (TPR) repeat protein
MEKFMSGRRLPHVLPLGLLVLLPLAFTAGCDRDPKVARLKYVNNGNKYFDKGKYKEASIMYRRALQKDLRYGEAWYRLGLTNLKLADFPEARKDFLRTMDLDPANLDAIIKTADLDLASAFIQPASRTKALIDLKDMISTLSKRAPQNYDVFRLSGYVSLLDHDNAAAVENFKKANAIKPDQSDLILVLVQTLIASGKAEEGESIARAHIAKFKNYGPLYDVLYTSYVRQKRLDEAENLLKEKIANNPTNGNYLVQLALHYAMTKRKSESQATLNRLTSDPKTFPNGRQLAGDLDFQLHELDSAYQEYNAGLKEDPKQHRLYTMRIIEVLSYQNKIPEATALATALMKEDPKNPEATALHATLLLEENNKAKAKEVIAELQPLVIRFPKLPMLHFSLGRAYIIQGDPQYADQARLQLEETLKLRPQYPPAKYFLALLALNRGDSAKAVQLADDVLTTDKNNPRMEIVRAKGLIGMNEKEKARAQILAILSTAGPTSGYVGKGAWLEAKYLLAVLDLVAKNYPAALAGFEELKRQGNPNGIVGIVEVKVAQKKYDEAESFIREQLTQTPDRQDYQMALANIQIDAGKFKQAEATLQKLIEKNPKSTAFYTKLGETRRLSGDNPGAINAFKQAHDLTPTDIRPLLQMAMVYDATGRNEDARRYYEEVLKINPDEFHALNNLAYLKADDGVDLDQALTLAQRAEQARPNELDVRDTVGFIYMRKNLTEDSIRMLKELVAQSPNRATFHLHLAMAYLQKGDKAQAKRELDAATRFSPSEKEQVRIKELSAKLG